MEIRDMGRKKRRHPNVVRGELMWTYEQADDGSYRCVAESEAMRLRVWGQWAETELDAFKCLRLATRGYLLVRLGEEQES